MTKGGLVKVARVVNSPFRLTEKRAGPAPIE
jgi:hypothetical protein